MKRGDDRVERLAGRRGCRQAARLECRQCGVICERVVSPWRCLKARYGCVYAYEEGDTTYFGCLHKVFSPELDLAAFAEERSRDDARTDPYGPIRVVRSPRPQCPVTVERAYAFQPTEGACANPGFLCGVAAAPGVGGDAVAGSCIDSDPDPRD